MDGGGCGLFDVGLLAGRARWSDMSEGDKKHAGM
jgi:hypothetical protein